MVFSRRQLKGRHAAPTPSHSRFPRAEQHPHDPAVARLALSSRKNATVVFSFAATAAVVLVNLVGPYSTDAANAASLGQGPYSALGSQGVVTGNYIVLSSGGSESYVSEAKKVIAAAASSVGSLPQIVPDPGSAQAIAHDLVLARGWDENEFSCLVSLWGHESGWRVNAGNVSSGAYGIPQALPGSKMASAGEDWLSNPATQIVWGLGYVSGRYGTPCSALASWQNNGWY